MNYNSSKLDYKMNSSAFTYNGAVSLDSPDPSGLSSGRLSMFFKAVRGLEVPGIYKYMIESSRESVIDTFLISFHIRDCRGGKGERDIGRQCLVWLFINHPLLFQKVVDIIPEYGRWDDLLQFFPGVIDLSDIEFVRNNYMSSSVNEEDLSLLRSIQTCIVQKYALQLIKDYENMTNGLPCSLAAKWAPTEGDSLDRSSGVFNCLAKIMNISPKILRKNYITPLRSYIKIVENFMCNNKWDEIDYNKVPSCAMKRLKNSFQSHDDKRFREWIRALKKGDPKIAKVNGNQLHPHDLIKEMRTKGFADSVCEAQWKIIEEECMKNGVLDNDIAVVDTSGSMHSPDYLPLDVACAMGLLISKCSVGKFKHHVLTFNSIPSFALIKDAPIFDRWKELSEISWGGSTDIQATFKLILSRGKEHNLAQEDMPKRLWIISDMQFDQVNYGSDTNFDSIDKMYSLSGYIRPHIIFWNVDGSSYDFPVSSGDHGTALISGFSPSVMKTVLSGDNSFSPYSMMRNCLDEERLKAVYIALCND
jgi:hypothetical protein